jgi:hypothetical protein
MRGHFTHRTYYVTSPPIRLRQIGRACRVRGAQALDGAAASCNPRLQGPLASCQTSGRRPLTWGALASRFSNQWKAGPHRAGQTRCERR